MQMIFRRAGKYGQPNKTNFFIAIPRKSYASKITFKKKKLRNLFLSSDRAQALKFIK